MKKIVVVESPYKGEDTEQVKINIMYARACIRDCIDRGEVPFASHLLFTQPGIINDNDPEQRKLGIEIALGLIKNADLTVVYQNLGISEGMKIGIKEAEKLNRPIEYRKLSDNWQEEHKKIIKEHPHTEVWGM